MKIYRESITVGCDREILRVFNENGVVVVQDVLSAEQVAQANDELWASHQLLGRDNCSALRSDSSSWSSDKGWPQSDGGRNFLNPVDPFGTETAWQLAQDKQIIHILKLLYKDDVICDSIGRWGVMRPTVPPDGRKEWRTEDNWLHWDQNPWTEPDFKYVQCFACLSDQTETSGGFLCVPQFHKQFQQWGLDHPQGTVSHNGIVLSEAYGRGNPFPVPTEDPCQQRTVRVVAKAGSMIFWDGRLPHQNYPNSGQDWRVVHYLNFVSASMDSKALQRRQDTIFKRTVINMIKGIDCFFPSKVTTLGRTVTGCPDADDPRLVALSTQDSLRRAVLLSVEAGHDEAAGDAQSAATKMRRALKLRPDLDDWLDALYGA